MSIEWREDFATGIESVDRRHKELFARCGRLTDAIETGRGENELLDLLEFLNSYTVEHFAAEERLQMTSFYPHLQLHWEEHRHFVRELDHIRERVAAGGCSPHVVLLASRTMIRWLINHICRMDKAFGDYMKSRRVIELIPLPGVEREPMPPPSGNRDTPESRLH